ncbi:hypothetical protein LMG28727_04654 [Paraburkholderia kirstenboschensis]|uniref:hypothetical protein n=1 Tax=Paraburkholderia kirstenboschensis TaxID=1245436 RepID=UPI000AAC7BAE|nr:hypothetical protein [Paraburkholderia kirstenboschensis]CAD6547080.1 hypothetical protein LMG28727_04654 [Paraburkholderia kirstenboschensis]
MKIRSAEFLAVVAIVTSASVLQIREHMQPPDSAAASARASAQAAPSTCESSRKGVMPAACEPTRDERPADHAPVPQRGAARTWV